jgi:hypothetical protein
MKNKELYDKTVSILVDAYFNDTLQHGICSKCAVGNLINAAKPFTRKQIDDLIHSRDGWVKVFCTINANRISEQHLIYPDNYVGEAKKQIDSTGYSWENLSKIEYAFETASEGCNQEDYMFNGLMAVIEILDEIHENKDIEKTAQSKKRFNKELVNIKTHAKRIF